jgi:hypothetical protein
MASINNYLVIEWGVSGDPPMVQYAKSAPYSVFVADNAPTTDTQTLLTFIAKQPKDDQPGLLSLAAQFAHSHPRGTSEGDCSSSARRRGREIPLAITSRGHRRESLIPHARSSFVGLRLGE